MNRRGRWLGLAGMMSMILLAASCGGGADTNGGEAAETSPVVTAVPDTTAADTTTAAPTTTAAAPTTGPPAPDFALELATGETFVLSEQSKPVLIIFWAEW